VLKLHESSLIETALIENHDEAYYLWHEKQYRGCTLVHVDAHHDMWYIADGDPITIGDYVCPALKEKIITRIYWVVPDESFRNHENQCAILEHVNALVRQYPGSPREIKVEKARISTNILNSSFIVCTAKDVPAIDEPVLLDIDVDYFVLPRVARPADAEVPGEIPWCWPDDLIAQLQQKINPVMTTIAYSVQGGTTPLQWKYLGQYLQTLLTSKENAKLRFHRRMRDAAIEEHAGNLDKAEEIYNEIASIYPEQASVEFRRARFFLKGSRYEEASRAYQRAVLLDPRYEGPFSSAGIVLEQAGKLLEAEKEYEAFLKMSPGDAYCHWGLAKIAASRQEWSQAKSYLMAALSTNPNLVDAHKLAGDVSLRLNDLSGAISAYESYLRLQRSGNKSLNANISTRGGQKSPDQGAIQCLLAGLYLRTGNTAEAIECFRSVADRIIPNTSMFLFKTRFAIVLCRDGRIRESVGAIGSGLSSIPRDMLRAARKTIRFVVQR
jgi:tetratricopeptide (TPR) repeat protein